MNFIFDILIPKREISKLKNIDMYEVLVEWNGEVHSQEPKKYQYRSETIFLCYSNMKMKYYRKMIDRRDNVNKYMSLYLKSDVLLKLHKTLKNDNFDNYSSEIVLLINDLYSVLNKFYIILLRDEEIIDKKLTFNNPTTAVETFLNCLDWENPKGIVISKKETITEKILQLNI